PLGFILLLLWILVYLLPRQKISHCAAAAILLSLTVLANFFNAITAIIFIASVLVWDIVGWMRASETVVRQQYKRNFLFHFLSPWLAVSLSAFRLAPMLSAYQYLVTPPLIRPFTQLIMTPLWCWYLLAIIGTLIWVRRPTGKLGPYLLASFILLIGLIFSGS